MARKKKHSDEHGGVHPDERWLVTYADMVTLLLAVFIVLYALSDTNVRKFVAFAQSVSSAFTTDVFTGTTAFTVTAGQESAPDTGRFDAGQGVVGTDFRTVEANVEDYIIGKGLDGLVEVEPVDEGIAIRIRDALLFNAGRARLDDGALDVLDRIVDIIEPLPNDLRIVGNTDDIAPSGPFYTDNFELSTARGLAVLAYLRERGVAAERLSVAGNAEFDPVVPNTSEENRAVNRRVDILILYPKAVSAQPDAPSATPEPIEPITPITPLNPGGIP